MGCKRLFTALIVLVLIGLLGGPALAQVATNNGEFLPAAGFSFASSTPPPGTHTFTTTLSSYANTTEYDDIAVNCPYLGQVGYLDFTYATWTGNTKAVNNTTGATTNFATGGGALAGGFYKTADCSPPPGWQLGWVQLVTATISGRNVWGAANGTWFPDTANKTDPDYPYQTLPGGITLPAEGAPTVAFQDFPNRYPGVAKPQTWLAELGLVCKNLTTDQMDVIGTFDWGFGINAAGAFTPTAPFGWGPATNNYISVLSTDFPGWTIERGCCCTPEPSTLIVWSVLGGCGIAAGCWRKRKAA